ARIARGMSRGYALPILVSAVLAIAMTWPLSLHLGSEAQRVEAWGDPLYLTWQVAWMGHALLHNPLHLFETNFYFPLKNNLVFTDVLFGYAPAGLLGTTSPHAALVVHNLIVIFTFALAFVGAFLLARELGAGAWGSVAAGAAFAYAPWKLSQVGHLQIISSGGIPLSLYFLVRGYRRDSSRLIVTGWLVAAWQMTLGFNLGLQLAYLLLLLGAEVAFLWVRQGRPRPSRSVLRGSAIGIAAFVAVTALVAAPYWRVQHDYPEATMPASAVAYFSPPPRAFLAAPSSDLVWGDATSHTRSTLRWAVEQTLFPGVTVLLLALLGLASTSYSRPLRLGLAAGTVLCVALSLGLPSATHPNRGFTPFRLLRDIAPGWKGVRTPGRINNLTSLGLALLAAAGVALVVRLLRRTKARGAAPLVPAVLVAAILVEGFGPLPHPHVPARPAAELASPAPQLHLPTIVGLDGIYAYWGIGSFPRMANAASSFDPRVVSDIRDISKLFPNPESVQFFRRIGIRSVVLHRDLARGTPWQPVPDRPTAGLGITRRNEGDLVIYLLR
ncbi:MAG: hypothetical protein ACXVRZ_14080, partial [Gaiellaceae bacterium]